MSNVTDAELAFDGIYRYQLDIIVEQQNIRLRNISLIIVFLSLLIGSTIGYLAGANAESFVSSLTASLIFSAACIAFVHHSNLHKKSDEESETNSLIEVIVEFGQSEDINMTNEQKIQKIIWHLSNATVNHNALLDHQELAKSRTEMSDLRDEVNDLARKSQLFKETIYSSAKEDINLKYFI